MKGKCTRGFGYITDPETGEEIDVQDTFEVEQDVFHRLKANYPGIEAVETPDSDAEDAPVEDDESEEYSCGVNGCSRDVDSPEEQCWQHSDD